MQATTRDLVRPAFAMLAAAWFCACQPSQPPPSEATQPPAELRIGEFVVRASTVPTPRLSPAIAQRYGVGRDPRTVLLVVSLREGTGATERSVPGTVVATATDLLGRRQPIALREVREDGFLDYVGILHVAMPDTLRFEVDVRIDGAAPANLRFHRDFFPPR